MSKSILIIDTPESCAKCPIFFGTYADMTCRGNGRTIDYPFPDNRIAEWCPLKEIPQKKPEIEIRKNNDYRENFYINGYNDCLDEILGGA